MLSKEFSVISRKLMDLYRIHNHSEMVVAVDVLIEYYGGFVDSYPAGFELNGWIVPSRWKLTDAYIELYQDSIPIRKIQPSLKSLFVWPFSCSVNAFIEKADLLANICQSESSARTFMFRPQYRHWENQWGFSLTADESVQITEWDGEIKVYIDSSFSNDHMVQHVSGKIQSGNNKV